MCAGENASEVFDSILIYVCVYEGMRCRLFVQWHSYASVLFCCFACSFLACICCGVWKYWSQQVLKKTPRRHCDTPHPLLSSRCTLTPFRLGVSHPLFSIYRNKDKLRNFIVKVLNSTATVCCCLFPCICCCIYCANKNYVQAHICISHLHNGWQYQNLRRCFVHQRPEQTVQSVLILFLLSVLKLCNTEPVAT